MNGKRVLLVVMCAFLLAANYVSAQPAKAEKNGTDLGIGRGTDSRRPNILVAWRNTERILEVEILVRNMGNQAGRGKVRLEICDDKGKQLLATQPYLVTVPARSEGGEDGVVVQTKGFRMMNIMFDELDRLNQRYKLRATVETEGDDLNQVDNVITKAFNVDARAFPGGTHTYRYQLTNPTNSQKTTSVFIDHSEIPTGWTMTADPAVGTQVVLGPGEVFTGYITVKTPKKLNDGQYIDFLAGLAEIKNGKSHVVDEDEWYLVATTQPPQVDKPTISERPDGTIAVNVAAFDPICGIKEASGVQVAYSLDHGTTFSTRVMAYTRGNFYDKTWFEGVLGPFAPGVEVSAVVTVSNNAGIIKRFDLPPVKISQTAKSTTQPPARSDRPR